MKTSDPWLGVEIFSILLSYAIGMSCFVSMLLGAIQPSVLAEGIFLTAAWWVVSIRIRDYRRRTGHPPDESAESK